MLTQNPLIGRAKKKLGNIYARTLYGKNVIQTCPPPTKGKQTPNQIAASSRFGWLSRLSNQVSASLLNQIYYQAPIGRSRRMQWMKDLASGMTQAGESWQFLPQNIVSLGSNLKVSETAFNCVLASTQLNIPIADLSAVGSAITTETPLLILICPEADICISLLPYTTLQNEQISLNNLSSTLIGKESYIFPLWKTNIGTQATPVITFGSYQKKTLS